VLPGPAVVALIPHDEQDVAGELEYVPTEQLKQNEEQFDLDSFHQDKENKTLC
jgi:hypothetical protein